MNKLQLVQRLAQECGVARASNVPATTVNQTGELKRLVTWIDNAWLEIQDKRPNWNWMIGSFDFLTVAGDYEYTPADAGVGDTFANWKTDSFRSWLASGGVGNRSRFSAELERLIGHALRVPGHRGRDAIQFALNQNSR